jgi:hypothetical protein
MLEAVSASILSGQLESDVHPLSAAIDTMAVLDEIRSQIK